MDKDVVIKNNVVNEEDTNSQEEIEPHLDYEHKSYLSTNGWSNVVNDNNWLNAELEVTNDSNNPGDIYVRVVDENGKIIVSSTFIELGDTITLDKIEFNAGKFYVQAKAKDEAGNYTIKVKD